ncbi:MAG: hypothetical protein GVY26_19210 [Bacteroidetes bacterium]|jgi:hypothetical protein|nr:hypothetical protein [Bacteroidota bacterium]
MTKPKFIGEAGEHFVAYKLARRNLYVGLTLGNMPNIDLLLSSNSGLKSISIQVKTSKKAYRKKRHGSEGYEWDVNAGVIGRHSIDFWYAFVDFKGAEDTQPDVYIVPSLWVSDFVKPEFSRKLYFLPKAAADLTRNNWGTIEKALIDDKKITEWASKWDEKLLVRWGN